MPADVLERLSPEAWQGLLNEAYDDFMAGKISLEQLKEKEKDAAEGQLKSREAGPGRDKGRGLKAVISAR